MTAIDLDEDTHGLALSPDVSAITPPQEMVGVLQVHRREIALVSERLQMSAGVPAGAWSGARDFVVDCVDVLGVPALQRMKDLFGSTSGPPPWTAPQRRDDGVIDAGGCSSLLVGAFVVGAALGAGPGSVTRVESVGAPDMLAAGALWAESAGLGLSVDAHFDSAVLRILPTAPGATPRCIGSGIETPASVWWPLYYAGNAALSPDTDLSRLHTGMVPPPSGIL